MKIKNRNIKIHNLKSGFFLPVFDIFFQYDGGTSQVQVIKIIMK